MGPSNKMRDYFLKANGITDKTIFINHYWLQFFSVTWLHLSNHPRHLDMHKDVHFSTIRTNRETIWISCKSPSLDQNP